MSGQKHKKPSWYSGAWFLINFLLGKLKIMEVTFGFQRFLQGFAIFSGIGILLVLISVGIFLYMMSLDSQSAKAVITETAQTQDMYELLSTSSDAEMVLRKVTEDVVLRDSMKTYGPGAIEITKEKMERGDGVVIYDGDYDEYKNQLTKEIKEKVFTYYHEGSTDKLNEEYSTPLIKYDFSKFITDISNFEIELTQDNEKSNQLLGVKINFKDGRGMIRSENTETGSKLTITVKPEVEATVRPFTIHEKSKNFVTNRLDSDDIRWIIWGIQTIIGLVEANTKREVSLATDPRITYTLTHLLLIWKESEEFGTIDYIHIPYEVIRPWIGSSDGASRMNALFSTLQEAKAGGYDEKLKKLVNNMEDVKNQHNNHIRPSAIKLWEVVLWLDGFESQDGKEELEERFKVHSEGEVDELNFDLNELLNKIMTEFFDGFSPPERSLRSYINFEFDVKEEKIQNIINSLNADKSTPNLESQRNKVDEVSSSVSDEYDKKKEDVIEANVRVGELKFKISEARSLLNGFFEYVNSHCDNELIVKKIFIDEENGITLNTSLKRSLDNFTEIEEELNEVSANLSKMQAEVNPAYTSIVNNLAQAKSEINNAVETNGMERDGHVANAINKLNAAKSGLVQLKNSLKNKGSEINQTLSQIANKIYHKTETNRIMDVVIELYLITIGIAKAKENLDGGPGGPIRTDGVSGALGFLLKILGPITDAINKFSSIGNMLKGASINIPNKYDQVLSLLPLPPWNPGGIFGKNHELSVVHEIWWQTRAGKYELDLGIIKIPLGSESAIQIPYTPIYINGFESTIEPLHVYDEHGNEKSELRDSHLRVIDFRNAHIGEILSFKFSLGGEVGSGEYPLPIKYHRYPLYHYRFKAPDLSPPHNIPVILIALGPFTQRMDREYIPSKKDPNEEPPFSIMVTLTNVSYNQYQYIINTSDGKSLSDVIYRVEGSGGSIDSGKKDIPYSSSTITINTANFTNYGWEVISVIANESDIFDFDSQVFMKPAFISAITDGNILTITKEGNKIRVRNNKNVKFEVAMKIYIQDGCCFLNNEGNWSNSISFELTGNSHKDFEYKVLQGAQFTVSASIVLPPQIISALKEIDSEVEGKLEYSETFT